ncbi:MAG TPA: adenylosuccinate synthetase [Stellaceae bacterium]|nr:adenylosuccinate synthetase [Stellaceae bacterium]
MKRATVVIGANFGDEGKGLMTDFHAAALGSDGLVVRFNGGAQAGHTVTTVDGKRHVFGHFGAGTFAGAPTFFSRFFAVNPPLFFKELPALAAERPRVYVDRDCPLTTPYDMMINQMAETARGGKRHGSCGIGFGETIERNLCPAFRLAVGDLDRPDFAARLEAIRREYVPQRLRTLGIESPAPIVPPQVIVDYRACGRALLDHVALTDSAILRHKKHIVFEGAQGLLLDEEHPSFPHVTRAKTGLKNVLALARAADIDALDVTYMTRAYMTRHGAGPFPSETRERPYPGIAYATNLPNRFQGALRFGWLDLDLLQATVGADLALGFAASLALSHRLAVTCLDQLPAVATFIRDGEPRHESAEVLVEAALAAVGASGGFVSTGPARNAVTSIARRASLAA